MNELVTFNKVIGVGNITEDAMGISVNNGHRPLSKNHVNSGAFYLEFNMKGKHPLLGVRTNIDGNFGVGASQNNDVLYISTPGSWMGGQATSIPADERKGFSKNISGSEDSVFGMIYNTNNHELLLFLDGIYYNKLTNLNQYFPDGYFLVFGGASSANRNEIVVNLGATPFKHFSQELKDQGYLPYDIDNAHPENMPSMLFLKKNGNKIYKLNDEEVSTVVTEENIEKIGFSVAQLSQTDLVQLGRGEITLVSPFKFILDIKGDKILEGEILAMLDEDKKTIPIAKTDIIPKAQLIKPKGDIVFKMLNSIEEMTLFADTGSEGVIKVIFSTDSGYSWSSYTNEGLIPIDINNLSEVKEKGLSPDEFNKINKLWSSIITDDKIRFAYYLEIDSKADMASVDKLEVKMNMYGRWNKVKEEDYDYGYDNDRLYIKFYKDGSYKINYQE